MCSRASTPAKTVEAHFDLLGRWLQRYGRPLALYTDRDSIFEYQDKGRGDPNGQTQFGRALAELDIELILARSPLAKLKYTEVQTECSPGGSAPRPPEFSALAADASVAEAGPGSAKEARPASVPHSCGALSSRGRRTIAEKAHGVQPQITRGDEGSKASGDSPLTADISTLAI